jgi:hypothetical protein
LDSYGIHRDRTSSADRPSIWDCLDSQISSSERRFVASRGKQDAAWRAGLIPEDAYPVAP